MGEAEVLAASDHDVIVPRLDRDPPPPAPVTLIAAVPRLKILRRVLQAVASMGVKKLVLLGSYRVEKSYFGSPFLEASAIRAELVLGLEQGRDTILPDVSPGGSSSPSSRTSWTSPLSRASTPPRAPRRGARFSRRSRPRPSGPASLSDQRVAGRRTKRMRCGAGLHPVLARRACSESTRRCRTRSARWELWLRARSLSR